MGVNPQIAGKTYTGAPVYEVGREKIREFAEAIRSTDPVHTDPEAARALGYPDVVAPPTFAIIVAQRCEGLVMTDPEAGIDYSRLVHGEQRFTHHRPIVAGDRLSAVAHVDDARLMKGNGRVITRVEITDATGAAVATAISTVVIRADEFAEAKA